MSSVTGHAVARSEDTTMPEATDNEQLIAEIRAQGRKTRHTLLWIFVGGPVSVALIGLAIWGIASAHATGTTNGTTTAVAIPLTDNSLCSDYSADIGVDDSVINAYDAHQDFTADQSTAMRDECTANPNEALGVAARHVWDRR